MLNKPKSRCSNLNEAHRVCFTKNCQHLPFICSVQNCSCHTQHQSCQNKQLSFQNLANRLLEKDGRILSCFRSILQFYDHSIKQLQIHKDYVLKIMDKGGLGMEKEESEMLFVFKNEGEVQNKNVNLTGHLVSKAIQCLDVDQSETINKLQDYIKSETEKFKKQFKAILTNTIKLMGIKQQQSFEGLIISRTLKSKDLSLYYPGVLEWTRQRGSMEGLDGKIRFGLFQPSLNHIPHNEITINIEIIQIHTVYFGILYKEHLQKNQFSLPQNDLKRGHLCSFAGQIISSLPEQNKKLNFYAHCGDILSLTFNKRKQELKIKNQSRNQEIIMKAPIELGHNYNFCIGLGVNALVGGLSPSIQDHGYQVDDQ